MFLLEWPKLKEELWKPKLHYYILLNVLIRTIHKRFTRENKDLIKREDTFQWIHGMENIIRQSTSQSLSYKHIFTVKNLPQNCTFNSNWMGLFSRNTRIIPQDKSKRYKKQMWCSLLLLAFGLPVHHLPEAGQDLALPLPPLLLVEGRQRSLLVGTVDLVFLSQTHSLHTAMSAGLHLNCSVSKLKKKKLNINVPRLSHRNYISIRKWLLLPPFSVSYLWVYF